MLKYFVMDLGEDTDGHLTYDEMLELVKEAEQEQTWNDVCANDSFKEAAENYGLEYTFSDNLSCVEDYMGTHLVAVKNEGGDIVFFWVDIALKREAEAFAVDN